MGSNHVSQAKSKARSNSEDIGAAWLTPMAFALCFFSLMSVTIMSTKISAQELIPDDVSNNIPNAQLVGKGMFSYFFWDIYIGELYAPSGTFQNQPPFALRLTYQRNLEGSKIAQRSIDEMQKQGNLSKDDASKWLLLMENIFPDVKEGDVITGIAGKEGTSVFYVNGEQVDVVDDADFTERFFAIWLSDKTSEPTFRRKLLGKG